MLDSSATASTKGDLDAHGNYVHEGDLHLPGESLDDLVPRMLAHLHLTFEGYGFSPSRETFAGGRSVLIKIVSGPAGLDDRAAEEAFREAVLKEMRRFDLSNGNVLSDYHRCSVFLSVRVDGRYHAQHAVVAEGTHVDRRMSVTEFRRTIRAGDRIVLESTDNEYVLSRGAVGVEREVVQVRTGDFIVEEAGRKIHFDFPKAAAFACDGHRFRISDARAGRPAGYRLYRWIRSA